MKSKSLRDVVHFCVIGAVVLGMMFYLAVRVQGNLPAYSVINKSAQGFSVYLETLQSLGVDARQSTDPIEQQPYDTIQIIAYGWRFDTTKPNVLKWIQEGGTLILAAPEPPTSIAEGSLISEKNGIRVYQVEKGRIMTISAPLMTNRALVKDTGPSWALTAELIGKDKHPVVFNERHLFPENGNPSLWKAAPLWVKLLVYQLLILTGAWFWMKGNRLGKPLPFIEETERTELEYLNAAAHFYHAAGCWQMMLDVYFRSLLRLLGAKEADWIEIWNREGFPDGQKADALQRWMTNKPPGSTYKEIQQQIMVIEYLKNLIKDRRQNPWNRLKHQ